MEDVKPSWIMDRIPAEPDASWSPSPECRDD
jgi:hypothetical protein